MKTSLETPADKRHAPLANAHQVQGVHLIAVFEALKGLIVLVAGFGLLHFVNRDLQSDAEELVRQTHLNPARHYPRIFIEAASRTSPGRVRFLAALAFCYASVRFVEAYGLWRLKAWAEWFAIVSGSLYVPIEIFELIKKPTMIRAVVLLANIAIVVYLIYVRWQNRSQHGKGPSANSEFLTS